MSFNREMAKIMAGKEVKVIHGECCNIDTISEWIKWLSYVPEFQQLRIQELNSKENISLEELDEIRSFKYQNKMLELFKLYGTSEISKDEYMEVYDFMENQSIDDLMLSKLTTDELTYAKEQINHFSTIPKEELSKKVKLEQDEDVYKNLSMVDSYILHIISRINYARDLAKLNREIEAKLNENDSMIRRSMYYAANPRY